MNKDIDIVIVGGGAAGIAAARHLDNARCSFVLLEASSRLGGRAWTKMTAGHPLDLGCGWLHSADRNPWTKIAEDDGFVIDRASPAWSTQFRNLGFATDEQAAAGRAMQDWHGRLQGLIERTDSAGDGLTPDGEWNNYIRAICGFSNGVAPEMMSAADYLAYDAACTYNNWRIPEGYGSMIISSLPSRTPLFLDTPVNRISDNSNGLRIDTKRGSLSARAAILTMSTNVLSGNSVALPPAIDPWRQAASLLPLGSNEKLFLKIKDNSTFLAETHLIGNPKVSETCDFYIRPFGWPVIECYLGGESAKIVGQYDIAAGFELATEQLVRLFGSDVRKKVTPIIGSNWGRTELIDGAYSSAKPGHSKARQVLAQSWDQRLFFAGEATHMHDYSTAHGAYASGARAAGEALSALKSRQLQLAL
ncbi:flavin monoamine oxidase family protein [Rhizobium sp. BK456]|uniref:flavin monoamine oxidase family protein n=1 Tax=Rhizobium sp. BK456 TaxID=2587007 RepID=UPI00160ED79A|nr:NAD(P)/FAD-dependent oxidoreductase [Rhizobium sp. BK456]MBB3527031.1 monoamine oxidase [Rhizobium sp. BK456]